MQYMKKFGLMSILAMKILLPSCGLASSVSDFLIMQDIGQYSFMGKGGGGQGAGILSTVGHFNKDHTDESYGGVYFIDANEIAVNVEVTKHAGSDSDKWLLHELDLEFRNYYGIPGYYIRTINGNTVYVYGAGGRDYRWLSGNTVIMIEYHDSQLTKAEPIEVIQAYLSKLPSSLPIVTTKDVMSNASKTQWIKDEIDRRLWICDKWFYQLQLGKVQQIQVYQESAKSMNIFLDYREKYYGIKAADDKNLLASYLNTNNGTGIKAKQTEYKTWWSTNKANAITLP